jgi:hypothetical protein
MRIAFTIRRGIRAFRNMPIEEKPSPYLVYEISPGGALGKLVGQLHDFDTALAIAAAAKEKARAIVHDGQIVWPDDVRDHPIAWSAKP